MTLSTSELLQSNLLAVFSQRDAAARHTALHTLWSPDGVFIDPNGRYAGLDAIERRVAELQATYPDFEFSVRQPAQQLDGVGRLAWAYGPPGKRSAVTGIDIAVTADGVLQALYAFVD